MLCHQKRRGARVQAFGGAKKRRRASDRHEVEADRVASSVLRRGSADLLPPRLGRASGRAGVDVDAQVARGIETSRGRGQPLPARQRAFMESRFGVDFGAVRIHADAESAALNRNVGARAFTAGRHIYFGQGSYQPHTEPGRQVLAHELTHVVQQRGGAAAAPGRVQTWDPGPLPSDDSRVPVRETRAEKIARFNAWHAKEKKSLGWTTSLPACPCNLTVTPGRVWGQNAANPNSAVWNDPTTWLWGYHKGAEWCMRTKKPSSTGGGEQCCYDSRGQFITHGSGAGSADKVSPDHSFWGHRSEDVKPADLAKELDGGSFGTFSKRYLEVRPTNNKAGCPRNS